MNPHPATLATLVDRARRASRRAHARYSGFTVGAALEDARGRCFEGANMENASYPLGVCAERVALMQWRFNRGAGIRTIVIFTPTETPTPPCGWCRDALLRWAPGASVYLASQAGLSDRLEVSALLPAASRTADP